MSKGKLFLISLIVIVASAVFIFVQNRGFNLQTKTPIYKPGVSYDADTAVNQAKHLYKQAKDQGVDFSKGPCLSNAVIPGWVVDIVHNPRETVDDLSENQCSAYIEGNADHFVELDLNGNLVKAL